MEEKNKYRCKQNGAVNSKPSLKYTMSIIGGKIEDE